MKYWSNLNRWVGLWQTPRPYLGDKMIFVKQTTTFAVLFLFFPAAVLNAYDYDPNDFATQVVSYTQGTGVTFDILNFQLYNDPTTALDRPSQQTTSHDGYSSESNDIPVNPVHPAWRSYQIVTVGKGGELILAFDHPIADDKNNPYGIDFIIFGNARIYTADGNPWSSDSDPEIVTVAGTMFEEPGIVSVSQDGITWYDYNDVNSPMADSFAPTVGYKWDDTNDVWADELDPTKPIEPNFVLSQTAGKTVAQVIEMYNGSAGGTGFDIGVFGLDWIQYVRIEDDPAGPPGRTTEIDAVADVSCCGDYKHPFPQGDINDDCRVNTTDFCILGQYWLYEIQSPDDPAQIADLYDDDTINFFDLDIITENWLQCTWECE